MRTRCRAVKRGIWATALAFRRTLRPFVAAARSRLSTLASVREAAARATALREQLRAAQDQVAACQERERLLERALQRAEREVAALTHTARVSAEETIRRTRVATDEIIGSAQAAVTETLTDARAAADETITAARAWADDLLEQTRARAQRAVGGIEQRVADRFEPLKTATDRLASDADRMVQDMESRIEAAAAELSAKIAAYQAERHGYTQGLAALIKRHAETLERVRHLQADVQDRLVPALSRLTEGLQGLDTSWLRPLPDKNALGRERKAGAPLGPTRPTAPSIDGEHRPIVRSGEISVSNVGSFREAIKFVRALSGLAGVETVRLRTYAGGVATVDVTAEGSLATLDVKRLDGFAVEIVETAPDRLVIHLTRRSYLVLPG